jgi:inosose dehydratase
VSRIGHVHLKQVRQDVLRRLRTEGLSFWDALRQGIFTAPGDPEGMLDLEPVLQALADGGYQGWLAVEAEQDPSVADPLEVFRRARQWLGDTAGL